MIKPDERPKYPSGIPRMFLVPAQPGDKFAMVDPEGRGGFVISEIELKAAREGVKKDKPSFLTDEEEAKSAALAAQQSASATTSSSLNAASSSSSLVDCPAELKCPFGAHLIKDAVLVPCCGHFICCDECIKNKISLDENIECPYDKCGQEIDMGTLSSITPYHETRKKVDLDLLSIYNISLPSLSEFCKIKLSILLCIKSFCVFL